jgi:hypothetical protein
VGKRWKESAALASDFESAPFFALLRVQGEAMPQLQLPIFSAGITHITDELGFECRDGTVTYFTGQMPVFRHAATDQRTFRMIISQFVVNGNARQSEVARAFGIPLANVKRAVRRHREQGHWPPWPLVHVGSEHSWPSPHTFSRQSLRHGLLLPLAAPLSHSSGRSTSPFPQSCATA